MEPDATVSAAADGTQAATVNGWGAVIAGDEFSYTGAPDPNKWTVYNGVGHNGNGVRSPQAWNVADGVATVSGDASGTTGGMLANFGQQQYGRWETRMRTSVRDPKYHPVVSLWPNNSVSPNCAEVDYGEGVWDTTVMKFHLHWACDRSTDFQTTSTQTIDSTQWHNYAVEWTPAGVTGYLDGVKWFSDTDPAHNPSVGMHQTLQLDWFPDGSATIPSQMQVDWVRVYAEPGTMIPMPPTRFLDTRTSGAVGPDSTTSFQVAGANGIPPNVSAVVFNLTVAEAKSYGFITAYASGTGRPNASNLNFSAGQVLANLVIVPVGADGRVNLYNRSPGATQLVADVSGYYLGGPPGSPGAFRAVGPSRFLDTRNSGPVPPDSSVTFPVAGVNGLPANVSAVVFNMTVADARSFGFITAYASGTVRPDASNINFNTGQIVPNLVTVPVGADGKVSLYNRSSGFTQLIADVSGYYLGGTANLPGAFRSMAPQRFLDTRTGSPVAADSSVSFRVAGVNGIPAGVSAVVFNLTVAEPKSYGFITAYASGSPLPNASNLNFAAGQIVPNLVIVPVGPDGKVSLYNWSAGSSQLIADVSGYYLPGATGSS